MTMTMGTDSSWNGQWLLEYKSIYTAIANRIAVDKTIIKKLKEKEKCEKEKSFEARWSAGKSIFFSWTAVGSFANSSMLRLSFPKLVIPEKKSLTDAEESCYFDRMLFWAAFLINCFYV